MLNNGVRGHPDMQQLQQLKTEMGVDEQGRPCVLLLEQMDGDMVHVPPGWMHCVINLQPCVKVVMDGFIAANFPAYMDSWRQVRVPYALPDDEPDYVNITDRACSRLLELARV